MWFYFSSSEMSLLYLSLSHFSSACAATEKVSIRLCLRCIVRLIEHQGAGGTQHKRMLASWRIGYFRGFPAPRGEVNVTNYRFCSLAAFSMLFLFSFSAFSSSLAIPVMWRVCIWYALQTKIIQKTKFMLRVCVCVRETRQYWARTHKRFVIM